MNAPGRDEGELDQRQCGTVLAGCPYGRLVFTEQALPVVVPVSFTLDGEAVVVAAVGDHLRNVTDGSVVVFQADRPDADDAGVDSVSLTGYATTVTDPAERSRLAGPWNGPGHARMVRIVPAIRRGRRFHLPHG